jgi:hypothetical protein
MLRALLKPAFIFTLLFTTGVVSGAVIESEVCVYGATVGGVSAACSAARLGKKVILIDEGRHVGGMTSSGIGTTDFGSREAIGGFALEFYQRMGKRYKKSEAWTFEPHVAEQELRAMIQSSGVLFYGERRLVQVKKQLATLSEMVTENGDVFRARVFIDASYEGDLMAKAGVKYTVGREGNALYGENHNGVHVSAGVHQFAIPVDAFINPGDPKSGLLALVDAAPIEKRGTADAGVPAYCFQICMTREPENRLPLDPPAGYNPVRYELLGRYIQSVQASGRNLGVDSFFEFQKVGPEKFVVKNYGPISADYVGRSAAYPEATPEARAVIRKEHEDYLRGLFAFLRTDRRVPVSVRKELSNWGLCKDEFSETAGWPPALYVRAARRMISSVVITEKNCRGEVPVEDPIGVASNRFDSADCYRRVIKGTVRNEGSVRLGVMPFGISYRAITPKVEECANLLVPVCQSASHVAHASLRAEPTLMILGQAAGTAASLAIDQFALVQQVKYDDLRKALLAGGAVLEFVDHEQESKRRAAEAGNPAMGLILDDLQGQVTGAWLDGKNAATARAGTGYIHDGNTRKGALSIVWEPEIAEPGRYEILVLFPTGAGRAPNVPVTLDVGGKKTKREVNENDPTGAVSIGVFDLPKGRQTKITLSNEGTNGHVVADAVQILPR